VTEFYAANFLSCTVIILWEK